MRNLWHGEDPNDNRDWGKTGRRRFLGWAAGWFRASHNCVTLEEKGDDTTLLSVSEGDAPLSAAPGETPAETNRRAEQGDADAMLRNGFLHLIWGQILNALLWLKKAADRGLDKARQAYDFIRDYYQDDYVFCFSEKTRRFVEFCLEEAKYGSMIAQYLAGFIYCEGIAVDRNRKAGLEWFARAERQWEHPERYGAVVPGSARCRVLTAADGMPAHGMPVREPRF